MRAERYDTLAILFHWTVAVLIVGNVLIAWSLGNFDEHDPVHDTILTVHKSIGATVLLLALLRLVWRHSRGPLTRNRRRNRFTPRPVRSVFSSAQQTMR